MPPANCTALELVSDLGLGAASDLAPDPLAVWAPAERDGTYPGAVRLVAVDRTFAVPTARSSRYSPDCSTGLALSLALDRALKITSGL